MRILNLVIMIGQCIPPDDILEVKNVIPIELRPKYDVEFTAWTNRKEYPASASSGRIKTNGSILFSGRSHTDNSMFVSTYSLE